MKFPTTPCAPDWEYFHLVADNFRLEERRKWCVSHLSDSYNWLDFRHGKKFFSQLSSLFPTTHATPGPLSSHVIEACPHHNPVLVRFPHATARGPRGSSRLGILRPSRSPRGSSHMAQVSGWLEHGPGGDLAHTLLIPYLTSKFLRRGRHRASYTVAFSPTDYL